MTKGQRSLERFDGLKRVPRCYSQYILTKIGKIHKARAAAVSSALVAESADGCTASAVLQLQLLLGVQKGDGNGYAYNCSCSWTLASKTGVLCRYGTSDIDDVGRH